MAKNKSSKDKIEKLTGKIPKKRNEVHLDHQINYKGTGFYKNKKKDYLEIENINKKEF